MSGHSKWASIKHKKGAADKKRGKIFTKLMREIMAAARVGGGDPTANPRLRTAIQTARGSNMPNDNIERAIKKGTGELEGVTFEEITYEGYGPQGVAILADCLTDNKNRTSAEVRSIFTKAGGSMGGQGSVAWMFEKKGFFVIEGGSTNEEALMEIVIASGAEDLSTEGDKFEVTSDPKNFDAVKKALEDAKVEIVSGSLTMIPKNLTQVTPESARSVIALIDTLDDHDDVQHVYTNCDIPDEVMKEMG